MLLIFIFIWIFLRVWRIVRRTRQNTKTSKNIQQYWTGLPVIMYKLCIIQQINQGNNKFSTIYSAMFNCRVINYMYILGHGRLEQDGTFPKAFLCRQGFKCDGMSHCSSCSPEYSAYDELISYWLLSTSNQLILSILKFGFINVQSRQERKYIFFKTITTSPLKLWPIPTVH